MALATRTGARGDTPCVRRLLDAIRTRCAVVLTGVVSRPVLLSEVDETGLILARVAGARDLVLAVETCSPSMMATAYVPPPLPMLLPIALTL